ncbi:MAG: aminoacyl-tRNA hydrolase [Chloroflexi bacterium]|nr:aminoacyl-tRNA hydrolase [Chloroflexota bacterium]MYD48377.1 aminoacyl-tRNA hydrolase [Chloroflexota bacterium]
MGIDDAQTRPRARIIVGLGNPGPRYRDTRHNVGFGCVDLLAERWGIAINDRRRTTALGQGYHNGLPVALARPRTFMNLSGESVAYLLARFGGRPEDLVIVYDEMALPLGRIRLRARGSDAGHNGIKDIIRTVRTIDFPRLRIGIGGPGISGSVDHVLGRFSDAEQPAVSDAILRAAEAVECLLAEGIDIAMNRYNTDPRPEPETDNEAAESVDAMQGREGEE